MRTPSEGPELHDAVLEQEIELLADLIDAVAVAGHPLAESEIDQALGVGTADVAAAPGAVGAFS